MTPRPRLTDEEILDLAVTVGHAHVSITRGALPSVVPAKLSREGSDDIVLLSAHPGLATAAERGDIVAAQVDAVRDGAPWSLLLTGPLEARGGRVVLPRASALLTSDCLSSGHGPDPLPRRGTARHA